MRYVKELTNSGSALFLGHIDNQQFVLGVCKVAFDFCIPVFIMVDIVVLVVQFFPQHRSLATLKAAQQAPFIFMKVARVQITHLAE